MVGCLKNILKKEKIKLKGKVRLILTDVVTGKQDISEWKSNLITTVGKQAILRRMGNINTKTNEGMITYGAVGTGTINPSISDTILVSEIARASISSATVNGLQLTLRVFYSTDEANGTLTEFGWFGEDATSAANTGTLFNRILIEKTKDSTKTLVVEQVFEFV